jgi:UDP-N-acetylmuramate dehydrogenase
MYIDAQSMLIRENVPLAPLTTLKVGGPARYFAEAASLTDVCEALDFARSRQLPLFVLGGGSNLVVADSGWPGLVLKIAIRGIDERAEDGKTVFEVGAGEEWDAFVARAVARDCAGIECMSGIPGTVGGTPVQNVGAYGQEVSQTISEVHALDLRDGQQRVLCDEACGFAYRTSIFNTSESGRYIILHVTYALEPSGEPRIEYADLKKYFAGRSAAPTLIETRQAVREIRRTKAMLLVEGDEDCRSAGSFFKNPIVSEAQYTELSVLASRRNLNVPRFSTPEGVKVSAAWLVEHSGFHKGFTGGAVGISRKHALAIVNRGGAKAAEVVALKSEIQQRVLEEWGVSLKPEPVFVGF